MVGIQQWWGGSLAAIFRLRDSEAAGLMVAPPPSLPSPCSSWNERLSFSTPRNEQEPRLFFLGLVNLGRGMLHRFSV